MLTRQILTVTLLIPFIEYYCFAAVRRLSGNKRLTDRKLLWILYGFLSLMILTAMALLPMWSTTKWPSQMIRLMVNILVTLFFGKIVIAIVMFAGDLIMVIRHAGRMIIHKTCRRPSDPSVAQGRNNRMSRSEFISRSALLCGGLMSAGLMYGMTGKYRYRIKHHELSVERLPGSLNGLRIVQLSDIHAGNLNNKTAVLEGIEMALYQKPDLILFTGDLVNYRSVEMEPYLDIFGRLKPPLGVYSILGNHDYGDYLQWPSESEKRKDFERLLSFQHAMGWQVLKNENRILHWKGSDFAIIGVENWSAHPRYHKYGDMRKALQGLENKDLPFKILLSHDPSHWDAEVRTNYPDIALTLSGHTHGMQMGIDIPGFKWSPAKYLNKRWSGLYRETNQYLYVNTGFGCIGYDGRLGIPPEITVIDLCVGC